VFKCCFIHSWGCLWRNLYTNIPQLTTSWCSITWAMWTYALVDNGGFLLLAAIHWLCSSLVIAAVHYMAAWWPSTLISINSHPIACCLFFLLLWGIKLIWECASWVIFSMAALAASLWTNWCLGCCGVLLSGVLGELLIGRLDFDPLPACWGVCVAMNCWYGKAEEDHNDKKWEVLRTVYLSSSQNRMSNSQLALSTPDESYCV